MSVSDKQDCISSRTLHSLVRNYPETARLMNLRYVNDREPGITRVTDGSGISYYSGSKKITSPSVLQRIQRLVIPPAWTNVWICPYENGHIQVTGLDAKNRKQYRYHPSWVSLRNTTKYHRLREFGHLMPDIRKKLQKDLSLPELRKEKVLATVVSIMEQTSIRVGNSVYEKLYGSFGLSTMKDKHVQIKGSEIRFSFKGKKGVYHDISMKSMKLAKIVRSCRDIPGKELFQYMDENGVRHSIDSGDVNEYIRELSGDDFTSKDFRTWTGTLHCLLALKEIGLADTDTQIKKNITKAMDKVAKCLGNTRTVCKKHYVHPSIISCYQNQTLKRYIAELDKLEKISGKKGTLNPAEQVLLKLLKKHQM